MGISESEKVILDWLAQQYDAMVALLAETVNIDSGSYNKKGVDAVGRVFRDHLSKAGIAYFSAGLTHPSGTAEKIAPLKMSPHVPQSEQQRSRLGRWRV
jgi:hypothetical protein